MMQIPMDPCKYLSHTQVPPKIAQQESPNLSNPWRGAPTIIERRPWPTPGGRPGAVANERNIRVGDDLCGRRPPPVS